MLIAVTIRPSGKSIHYAESPLRPTSSRVSARIAQRTVHAPDRSTSCQPSHHEARAVHEDNLLRRSRRSVCRTRARRRAAMQRTNAALMNLQHPFQNSSTSAPVALPAQSAADAWCESRDRQGMGLFTRRQRAILHRGCTHPVAARCVDSSTGNLRRGYGAFAQCGAAAMQSRFAPKRVDVRMGPVG